MAIDTIKSSAVLDGAIATADIADDAVTSDKLDTNISVDGNLGLGTSVSTRKLNVNAGSYGHMLLDTADASHGIQILGQANAQANSGFDIQYAASTGMKIRTLAVQPLSLQTSASAGSPSDNLHIHTNGIVSIPNGIELGSGVDATAANVLDDYEEGAWTPFYTSQHGNLSLNGNASNTSSMYSTQAGSYIKIGKKVICHMTLATTGVTSFGGSGNLWVAGLPFATATTTASKPRGVNGCMAGRFNSFTPDQLVCNSNATTIQIRAGFETYPDINKLDVGGSSNRNVIEALIVYETA